LFQVSNPSIDGGATILRKIPNRQKSLSLQKSRIASKAILESKGISAPSPPEVSLRDLKKQWLACLLLIKLKHYLIIFVAVTTRNSCTA